MVEMVLGFAFTPDGSVCLLRKIKPQSMYGRLNGPGGKVEAGENSEDAMSREFFEETGVRIEPENWQIRGEMTGPDWTVHVYSTVHEDVDNVQTMETEVVGLYCPRDISHHFPMDNISALVELCRIPDAPWFSLTYHN